MIWTPVGNDEERLHRWKYVWRNLRSRFLEPVYQPRHWVSIQRNRQTSSRLLRWEGSVRRACRQDGWAKSFDGSKTRRKENKVGPVSGGWKTFWMTWEVWVSEKEKGTRQRGVERCCIGQGSSSSTVDTRMHVFQWKQHHEWWSCRCFDYRAGSIFRCVEISDVDSAM